MADPPPKQQPLAGTARFHIRFSCSVHLEASQVKLTFPLPGAKQARRPKATLARFAAAVPRNRYPRPVQRRLTFP